MAQTLGYDFDKVAIRRGHYFPKGLGDIEDDQYIIRRGLAEIFSGKKLFPVLAFAPQSNPIQNKENQKQIEPESR